MVIQSADHPIVIQQSLEVQISGTDKNDVSSHGVTSPKSQNSMKRLNTESDLEMGNPSQNLEPQIQNLHSYELGKPANLANASRRQINQPVGVSTPLYTRKPI